MPIITKHASMRLLQRCGVQKKTQAKVVRRAWSRGVTHSESSIDSNLKRWIDGLYLSHRKPNKILLYGNGAYLFKDDILITVIHIPESLQECVNRLRKEKEFELNKQKGEKNV